MSGSDQRKATYVGDWREAERPAARDPSSRVPPTPSLPRTANRSPAFSGGLESPNHWQLHNLQILGGRYATDWALLGRDSEFQVTTYRAQVDVQALQILARLERL